MITEALKHRFYIRLKLKADSADKRVEDIDEIIYKTYKNKT